MRGRVQTSENKDQAFKIFVKKSAVVSFSNVPNSSINKSPLPKKQKQIVQTHQELHGHFLWFKARLFNSCNNKGL